MLPTPHLIPQDKANHQAYGARIAMLMALAMVVLGGFMRWPTGPATMGAALAGAAAAVLAGRLKEWLDQRANARALAAGEPPVHSVERGDMVHTAYGGAAVALPLLAAGMLAWGV